MSSAPGTMNGISISKTGGPDVLEYKTDLPVPPPKEGQVLIKNESIGVNFIDIYFRIGLYPAPSFPYLLGREAAGTVQSIGSGQTYGLQPGDRVVYLSQSAYAGYTAAEATHTHKLPDGISFETAAASLLQGLTALTLIREGHHVNKGDWVLVHAGAGGMGLWLCQLLRAIGARTIATASTDAKRKMAKDAGADVTLEYAETMGKDAFVAKVKELTGGNGVAVVFDGVGKSTFDVSLECVARKGSMISYGNASGAVEPFTISRLSAKNARLMRPTLFNFIATKEEFDGFTNDLFQIMEKEKIDPHIHKTYDLKDAATAQSDMEGRKTTGKLLLKP